MLRNNVVQTILNYQSLMYTFCNVIIEIGKEIHHVLLDTAKYELRDCQCAVSVTQYLSFLLM